MKPVSLGGSIVKRASLHNFDEIKKLGVNIGSKVLIKKAAEIIPKVIKTETPASRTFPVKAYFSVVIQKHCLRQLRQEKIFQALSSPCANLRIRLIILIANYFYFVPLGYIIVMFSKAVFLLTYNINTFDSFILFIFLFLLRFLVYCF